MECGVDGRVIKEETMRKTELILMLERWYNERDGFDLCNDTDCQHCPRIRRLIKYTKKILKGEGAIK